MCMSYLEMEKQFKIYVYQEGEPPMFHDGPCKSIYSTEGRFIHEMERGHNMYRTTDPDEALVYFLPFGVVMLVQYLYEPRSRETHAIGRAMVNYIDAVAANHPFWNRSLGADHFMLFCHDWVMILNIVISRPVENKSIFTVWPSLHERKILWDCR
ncbi:hypothetical protein ACJRO7_000508 [Eucalyptus globulus]|uniref:Exostosin GT47 domain-containing protein n=1 Tax=Eucalyptus globulus TaxID=34317 RepID=A0ABD3LNV1_EUCGL